MTQAGGEARIVAVDVRDPEACDALAKAAASWYGSIDFVHANAGIADQGSIADGDPARWQQVIDTNLLGAAFTIRAVLPTMIAQRSGHVFFTASTSGRDVYVGEPCLHLASKWGLVGFGYAAQKELSRYNIRVTLVEPGLVDSPLTRNTPAVAPLLAASEPLLPQDVARAVVYAYLQPSHVNVSEFVVVPVHDAPDSARAQLEPRAGDR